MRHTVYDTALEARDGGERLPLTTYRRRKRSFSARARRILTSNGALCVYAIALWILGELWLQ
jgi:hypothetical protein